MAIIRDAFLVEAEALSVPVSGVADGLTKLWRLTDDNSLALVRGRLRMDIEFARRQDRQRQTTLRRLLEGQLSAGEGVAAGATYGLRPEVDYWVVRARTRNGRPPGQRLELSAVGAPRAPLVFDVDGDFAAVLPYPLGEMPDDAVVAQVGPVRLSRFHDAFVRVTRTLNAAARYRLRGVVDSATLGLKLAVVEQEEISGALVAELIMPVVERSELATEILTTVRTFLDNERRYQQTAAALSMHVNTLRYRLQKYEELTGADLAGTDGLVRVWWALQAWTAGTEPAVT
jgi:putative transposase